MRKKVSLALVCSAFLLGACNTANSLLGTIDPEPNQGPCPAAGSLYEAQRVVMLDETGQQKYVNIEYTGEITAVELYCRYVEDSPITAQLDLTMSFGRGEAATTDTADYQYFVAVTRTNRTTIEKEVFPITVKFPRGEDVVTKRETVGNIVIPRADSSISGANFEVLVGFELTPEQRQFNENGQRFLLQTR